jgi:hypothetical protein
VIVGTVQVRVYDAEYELVRDTGQLATEGRDLVRFEQPLQVPPGGLILAWIDGALALPPRAFGQGATVEILNL